MPVVDLQTPPAAVVSPDGFSVVVVGLTLQQVGTALGEVLKATYDISDECAMLHPTTLPPGMLVMVTRDTVVRIDVDSVGVATAEGARVGDTEASVLARYKGRVTVEPHKYTGPDGHYLVVSVPGDTVHRIIFETDGAKVLTYRAGRRPEVELVEGCA